MRALTWRASVAVVAVALVAGACGNSTGAGDGDDGGLRKLPLGAVGASRSSAAMSAEAPAADSSKEMLAPFRAVEYRVAEDASPVPETAEAYEVKPLPADEVRSKVAKALEVDEDVVEVGALGYDWYYSGVSPDTAVSSSVSSSPACAPDEKCISPDPSPPPTVAGVPSAADAERRVRDLLKALGASLDGRFEVFGEDGYNRTVQFIPSIDGVPVAGLQTQVAFGGAGRIEYANGLLADVESIGEYPLVGLAEAVKRLQEGFGSGGVRNLGAPEMDVASDPAATSGSGGGSSGSAGSTGSGTVEPGSTGTAGSSAGGSDDVAPPEPSEPPPACAQDEPCAKPTPACGPGETCAVPPSPPDEPTMTIEPQPAEPIEPQVIDITGADLSLQLVAAGCPGDPVYLVPTFDLLPGPAASVIAVEDDVIAGQGTDAKDAQEFEPCPGQGQTEVPMGKPEPAPMPADAGREPANP